MGSGATAKYALPYMLDTDAPDIPGDIQALANAIDAILAPWKQDVLANRPAAGKTGRTFTQTDGLAGTTWRDSGADWRALGSRVQANAAGDIAQVIRGFAGQTADLFQTQDSAGNVVASINNVGTVVAGQSLFVADRAANGYGVMSSMSNAASVPFVAKGASAQTADLQQWQDSGGGILAKIRSDGLIAGNYLQSPSGVGPYLSLSSTSLTAQAEVATHVAFMVKGFSGQSSDLQQWQDSTGAVLSSIRSDGVLRVPYLTNTADDGPLIQATTAGFVVGTRNATTSLSPMFLVSNNIAGSGTAGNVASVVMAVRGATGQTGDLIRFQNGTGGILGKIKSDGSYGGTQINAGQWSIQPGASLNSVAATASTVAAIIQGATAQTADLQQWRDSTSAVLAKVDSGGSVWGPTLHAGDLSTNLGAFLNVVSTNAGATTAAVRAAASQTADLQQWQNSAGTALAKVTPEGYLQGTSLYVQVKQQSTSTGCGVGANTPISWDAITIGNTGMWNATHPTRLVAPVTGVYLVYSSLGFNQPAGATEYSVIFRKNGTTLLNSETVGYAYGGAGINGSGGGAMEPVALNAGDYIEVCVNPKTQPLGTNQGNVAFPTATMLLIGK